MEEIRGQGSGIRCQESGLCLGVLRVAALIEVLVLDLDQIGVVGIALPFERVHVARGGVGVAGPVHASAVRFELGAMDTGR